MLACQAIEFLWVVLTYLGVEHQSVDPNGYLHLDYLPYSHSPLTGFGSAVVAYVISVGASAARGWLRRSRWPWPRTWFMT
jgi:hypothetical protein